MVQVEEAFEIYSRVVDGSIDKQGTHKDRPEEWWTQMKDWMKQVQYPWELVIEKGDRVNWIEKGVKGKCDGYRDQKIEGHPTGVKTIMVDFTSEGAEGFCCERGKFEQEQLEVIPTEDQVRGPWSVVRGPWSVVRGPWSVVRGPWSVVRSTVASLPPLKAALARKLHFWHTRNALSAHA